MRALFCLERRFPELTASALLEFYFKKALETSSTESFRAQRTRWLFSQASSKAQYRSAQYQSICRDIQSFSYVGRELEHVRDTKKDCREKNKRPGPFGRQTYFLVYEQTDASDYIYSPCQIPPERMGWNEIRRQLLEGDPGKEFGVKKVRHAKET